MIVAIIDTGIDFTHPDLQGQFWTNTREIPGNGLDDDHNGYVDDVHGWDYSANDTTLVPVYEDNDPTDLYGHGSHIAGIIAATTNNGVGIAGIAPHAKLMPLKFYPMMFASSAARAIVYATDNGADVINMSWGSPYPSKLLEDALNYARSKGVVLCAATGNSGQNEAFYPSVLPSTIAVGATDSRDRVTSFSTYGTHVDVVAPGESILSLRGAGTDMYGAPPSNEPVVHIIQNYYYEASGTSMACPHVAAVAAYVKSVSTGLVVDRVQQIIQQSAKDLTDPYGTGGNNPGQDIYSGYGRINLRQALALVPATQAQIESPRRNSIVSGLVNIFGVAAGSGISSATVEFGNGANPSTWYAISSASTPANHSTLAEWNTDTLNGCYTLRLKVGDVNESQVTLYVANGESIEIISPAEAETLSTTVSIQGSASAIDFQYAVLDVRAEAAGSQWELIDTVTAPVYKGLLSSWNAASADGESYVIRLSMHTRRGIVSDSVAFRVRSPFSAPNGWRANLGGIASIVPNYGDFNGDGQNEIVVGTSAGVKFFRTDGTAMTTGVPSLPPLDFQTPIAVGKLDYDDIDDFVAVSQEPQALYIQSSANGLKSVWIPQPPNTACFARNDEEKLAALSLKDIDGDGIDEIQLKTGTDPDVNSASGFYIWRAGGSLTPIVFYASYLQNCLTTDLNGDGIDEIYCLEGECVLRCYDQAGVEHESVTLTLATGFLPQGMSAVDVDDDGKRELLVFGRYRWSQNLMTYWLHAFRDGLAVETGWPRRIPISRLLIPTMPVFGDIDGDSLSEYVSTCYDLNYGHVYAWRHDGRPYLGDSTSNGFFNSASEPSMLNMAILGDVNDDNDAEIVSCAIPDAWGASDRQGIFAWNREAAILPGWPLNVAHGTQITHDYANTPVIGDINQDGKIDLMMTTALGELVFLNFPDRQFRADKMPCPMWRYNRRLNNNAPYSPRVITDVVDQPQQEQVPSNFTLEQNYPNPFNSSTMISYSLPRPGQVGIEILNILGQVIRSFDAELQPAGRHTIEWDAKNDGGEAVASGVYFFKVSSRNQSAVKKIVLLK